MTRAELEHIIRASGEITGLSDFVIIGSQSLLGSVPNPAPVFTMSMEADIYPQHDPAQANTIDVMIGEGSQFHVTHGYYAQGVGPETPVLPRDWLSRVSRVQNSNTNGRTGLCLSALDLFLAKAVASREKDREFCIALLRHEYVTPAQLFSLVPTMPLDQNEQRRLRATIRRWADVALEHGHDEVQNGPST